MPSDKIKIELLAPARDKECAFAAIDHGADAVYIGAQRYGARAAAGNSDEDIAQVVRYAHPFGVKVYVTLNTLLANEEELREARDLAWRMHAIGVDALIVQDERLRTLPSMPPIPLHASTQMDNRTAEKVQRLYNEGYEQVVLARELTIEEIAAIHRQVPRYLWRSSSMVPSALATMAVAMPPRSAMAVVPIVESAPSSVACPTTLRRPMARNLSLAATSCPCAI